MVKPISYLMDSPHVYPQALSAFGILKLVEKLSNFCDPGFQPLDLEEG